MEFRTIIRQIPDPSIANIYKSDPTPSKINRSERPTLTEDIVTQLRSAGFIDGEVLEINQVTAYFNYANRTVLGLGCSTTGDILGLSPNNSDNPDDWSHT